MAQRRNSCQLFILEGADGSGKSTLAESLRWQYDAKVVHCGPFPGVAKGLARLYVEAMLPALLGYQPIIMDRSWISETIYGPHYRGKSRLSSAQVRMLERVALRCGAEVILCQPERTRCVANYEQRRGAEYLNKTADLLNVYDAYAMAASSGNLTGLALQLYDYQADKGALVGTTSLLHETHPVDGHSGGHLHARVLLVGEAFADHRDQDPLAQTPFVAFDRGGCSHWLTDLLIDETGLTEQHLLWANADSPGLQQLAAGKQVIALGRVAAGALEDLGIAHIAVDHPQHAKRFNYKRPYDLIERLKEIGP